METEPSPPPENTNTPSSPASAYGEILLPLLSLCHHIIHCCWEWRCQTYFCTFFFCFVFPIIISLCLFISCWQRSTRNIKFTRKKVSGNNVQPRTSTAQPSKPQIPSTVIQVSLVVKTSVTWPPTVFFKSTLFLSTLVFVEWETVLQLWYGDTQTAWFWTNLDTQNTPINQPHFCFGIVMVQNHSVFHSYETTTLCTCIVPTVRKSSRW